MTVYNFDPHLNFAVGVVLTAPTPAISGTTLTLTAGQGANFPDPAAINPLTGLVNGAYNCVVWATAATPINTNAEVVRVTARAGDVFTITRAQESSSSRTILVGDNFAEAITAKAFTDIEFSTFTFINAQRYGIKGDGSSDDTSALQSAFNAVPSTGGIVYLPPSTSAYLYSSISPKPHTYLLGGGIDRTILRKLASARDTEGIRLDTNAADYFHMSDLTLDGNYPNLTNPTQNTCEFNPVSRSHILIENCKFQYPQFTSVSTNGATDMEVRFCEFIGNNNATSTNALQIGIAGAIAANNIRIHHNTFRDFMNSGIFTWASALDISYNYFKNNHIQTVPVGGGQIAFNGESNGKVTFNYIDQGGGSATQGIEVDNTSTGLLIEGNYIYKQGNVGINIQEGAVANGSDCNVIVKGNIVRSCQTAGGTRGGIEIQGNKAGIQIIGNRVYDDQMVQTQSYGLYIVGSTSKNIIIQGNDFRGNAVVGIKSNSADPSVGPMVPVPISWVWDRRANSYPSFANDAHGNIDTSAASMHIDEPDGNPAFKILMGNPLAIPQNFGGNLQFCFRWSAGVGGNNAVIEVDLFKLADVSTSDTQILGLSTTYACDAIADKVKTTRVPASIVPVVGDLVWPQFFFNTGSGSDNNTGTKTLWGAWFEYIPS